VEWDTVGDGCVRHGGLTSGTDCVDAQELSFFACEVSVALISKEKQKHGHKESTKCAALVVVNNLKLPLLENDLRFFPPMGHVAEVTSIRAFCSSGPLW